MKLASFEVTTDIGPARRVGIVTDQTIVDVTASYAAVLNEEGTQSPHEIAKEVTPPGMIEFLRRGEQALTAAREALSLAVDADGVTAPNGARLEYKRDDIRLLSPLPRPNSIRDFMSFEEHIQNSLEEVPEVMREIPIYYKGNPDTVVHPNEDVTWPSYTEKLDYELELCAVVGKGGENINAADAQEHIAGYTIFNDFSARDIQMKEMAGKLGPAKGKDFANGFGPHLVTADEIDIEDVHVSARVNDEVWSEGSTEEMIHSFPEIIEYISQNEPIHPGDVLGTGTVGGGCGLELDRWLEVGDVVELEAEGIGVLEHRIVGKSSL